MVVKKKGELIGHNNPIFTLELSNKPEILFSGGNDKGLVEWSLKRNEFIKILFPVQSSIYAIHCPVLYPLIFAGLRNGDIVVYSFIDQKIITILKHHNTPVFDIKSIKHKNELIATAEDGTISIWDIKNLTLLHTIILSKDTIRCIAISPDEKLIAFGCRDTKIKVYKTTDFSLLKTLEGHSLPVFSIQFSHNNEYLISGGRDAQVKVWDMFTYIEIINIPAHLFAVNSIAVHPYLPYFATASMDKSIKIWSLEDFKLYKTINLEKGYLGHRLSINKIVWKDNDLISTSDDKSIIIWEIII